jgi:hypothetical protein
MRYPDRKTKAERTKTKRIGEQLRLQALAGDAEAGLRWMKGWGWRHPEHRLAVFEAINTKTPRSLRQ